MLDLGQPQGRELHFRCRSRQRTAGAGERLLEVRGVANSGARFVGIERKASRTGSAAVAAVALSRPRRTVPEQNRYAVDKTRGGLRRVIGFGHRDDSTRPHTVVADFLYPKSVS